MDILGTSNKLKKQFYKLELTDYALPGFCTGGSCYYGTLDGIRSFILTMKKISDSDLDDLEKALKAYLMGDLLVKHTVAYNQKQFLVPVKLIDSNVQVLNDYKWPYTNIWGCHYYMKFEKGIVHEVVLKDGKDYIRCLKPDVQNLMYNGETFADCWRLIGAKFWGFPGLIRYDKSKNRTFSDLFFVESVSKDWNDCLLKNGRPEEYNFEGFCEAIFGDG